MTTLSNLKIVKRDLKIQNNTITDLSLDSLKEVNGEIIIKENNKLTDLNLKSLNTVTKFTLENNELLQGKETEEGEKVDVKPANQVAFEGAGTSPIFNKDTLEQNNINIQNVNLESLTINESKVDLNPERIGNIVALNNGLPKNFKVEDGKQVYSSDINIKFTDIETEYQGYDQGVLAKNGKIYCPPYGTFESQKDKVLEIDPNYSTADVKTFGKKIGDDNQYFKYFGGVLANNGKIYCPPYGFKIPDIDIYENTNEILLIDPSNENNNTSINLPIVEGRTDYWDNKNLKYIGGVLANNGKIYCAPYGFYSPSTGENENNTNVILVIDPSNNKVETLDLPIPNEEKDYWDNKKKKFGNGALANNGKIYYPPYGEVLTGTETETTKRILVITPNEEGEDVEVDFIEEPTIGTDEDSNKYSGGVLANNGKIYCNPANFDKLLVIDPSSES